MSGPDGVLATLDRCASRHDCAGDYGHAEELREARAVAADAAADLRVFASDYVHGRRPDAGRLLALAARLDGDA